MDVRDIGIAPGPFHSDVFFLSAMKFHHITL